MFSLGPLKRGVQFCLLPSRPCFFLCFSPLVSMWRHCKTGAADSPAWGIGALHLACGDHFFCRAPSRNSCILRPGRGMGRWHTTLMHNCWNWPACVTHVCNEQHSYYCSTLFISFFFKARDFKGCLYKICTYFVALLAFKKQTVFQKVVGLTPPFGEYLLGFVSLCSELLTDCNSISSLIFSDIVKYIVSYFVFYCR